MTSEAEGLNPFSHVAHALFLSPTPTGGKGSNIKIAAGG